MILDFIFIAFAAWFFLKGYRKGIVVATLSFVALCVGAIAALKLSDTFATMLFKNSSPGASRWAPLITYAVIFTLVILSFRLIARVTEQMMKRIMLGWANKLGGGLMYVLIITFIFSSLLWLGNKVNIWSDNMRQQSRVFYIIEPLAPRMYSAIGSVIPAVRRSYDQLNVFFDDLNHTLQEDVATH